MRVSRHIARLIASFVNRSLRREVPEQGLPRKGEKILTSVQRLALIAIVIIPALAFGVLEITRAKTAKTVPAKTPAARTAPKPAQAGKSFAPIARSVQINEPINVTEAARQEALAPAPVGPSEIRSIDPPRGDRPTHTTVPIVHDDQPSPQVPPPSATGVSPGPTKTYQGEFLSGTSIPPDTMGAVGTTHTVTVSNNMMRFQTREGVQITRMTMTAFWAGSTVKGVAVASAFDTKVYFDRFNSRFILISSLNGPSINSGAGVAVTQTADPTGTWNRFTVASDPTSTATAGHAIDYPSVGFNKNWIVVDENVFNYTGAGFSSYFGQQIFVFDKAAAYANTLGSATLFEGAFTTCTSSATPETELGCGFTMAPTVNEENTTDTLYLVEDWDSTAAQLRLSKMTGTPALPVLTVGTQFPQSTLSWRFDARRIATSGGYLPQHQQQAHLPSGTRIMANDSRIQNAVLRAGSLWTTHTVMLSTTPQPAGTVVGGTSVGGTLATRDNHSGIQWWQINPTIETGLAQAPLQRARIEDPTSDNCHDGNGVNMTTGTCLGTANQLGEFFAYPNIAVNQNNDVLIGFSKFSPLTYPSGGYVIRRSSDPVNTTRDQAIFRPGQANYNIGAGAGGTTARQNRWGDYSASQTDPLDDTNFWTIQEYAGAQRDFGIGIAGPWETWYAQVNPAGVAPSTTGNLIISEFRLRGPQGVNDEFVELYNPATTPVTVTVTDNSDGWALGYSTTAGVVTAVAVIPNGTVIPAQGHLLIARDQDAANGPTLVYSLNTYPGATNPSTLVRGSDSDVGYAIDNPDNGGFALFKTSTVANFSVATRMDSVGFASTPVGLFKEGTGIPDVAVAGAQQTFFRNLVTGTPKDTDNNVNDFIFADTAGTLTAAGQRLGAPGPENLDAPLHNTKPGLTMPKADPAGAGVAPNFVYDPTPVTNGTAGTITVRRLLFNNTGNSISRVRLRFVDLTTFPQPAGTADLRVLNSTNLTVETPPAQTLGGGLDSSVAPPVVTFATPIANGASIPVDFLFGVNQTGCFRFIVVAEALPGGANTIFGFAGTAGAGAGCLPTAAPARISGQIVMSSGQPLAGVVMRLSGAQSAITVTDSNGNYRFNNAEVGSFYTVTPELANYSFAPADRSFALVGDRTDAVFTASANGTVTANAIDTTEYFVRQHYLDFLGREPEPTGFAYWTDQLNQCGADADCVHTRRLDISAAFFRSQEFQVTGSFVYRLYSGTLGRQLRYGEFSADRARVVGGPNLEASKAAFADVFVQRAEFAQRYQASTTADAFVDALLQTMNDAAGVNLSSERSALINRYHEGGSMSASRALVVRQLVDNASFSSAVYNESFVTMEYFGYLHRSAEADGYNFWLNVLNNSDRNNYRGMVCSFITSAEYQRRFSSAVTHSNAECSGLRSPNF